MTLTRPKLERDNTALLRLIVMPALMVILLVVFTILAPGSFFTWYNIKNILAQSSYVIIAAIGLTFVMIGGGMDLSIGYNMSLCGYVGGMLMIRSGWSMWAAMPLVLGLGIICGLFNGIIVVKLKVFPLIITLSTAMIFQGISFWLSKSVTLTGYTESFKFIGQGFVLNQIPFCVILFVIFALIAYFILSKTHFGRFVYATGGNEEAAKLSGINTNLIRVTVYAISGFCAAAASLVLSSRIAVGASTLGPGNEFTALSGCILGGVTLSGGEGNIGSMVVGALIITMLGNGMQLMGLGTYPQYIAKGVVLIAAMGFDVYQRNKKTVRKLAAG